MAATRGGILSVDPGILVLDQPTRLISPIRHRAPGRYSYKPRFNLVALTAGLRIFPVLGFQGPILRRTESKFYREPLTVK